LIAFGLVSALGLAILTTTLTIGAERRMSKAAERTLDFLSATLASPMWSYDAETIRLVGTSIERDELVLGISISDEKSRIFYESEMFSRTKSKNKHTKTITYQETTIGSVTIALSNSETVRNLTSAFFAWLATLGAAIISMKAALSSLVERFIESPIRDIGIVSDRFAAGDFSAPVPQAAYAEFEAFSRALHAMAETIGSQFTDIKTANASLGASILEKEFLLRELQHRVKNSLQQMAALAAIGPAGGLDGNAAAVGRAVERRIQAMADLYDLCSSEDRINEVVLGRYLETVCRSALPQRSAGPIELDIDPSANASVDHALLAGLLVAELVSTTVTEPAIAASVAAGATGLNSVASADLEPTGLRLSVRSTKDGTKVGIEVWALSAWSIMVLSSPGFCLLGLLEDELGAAVSLDHEERRIALSFILAKADHDRT